MADLSKIIDLGTSLNGNISIPVLKGDTGEKGEDGHSPVVTATKQDGVLTLYVDGTAIGTVEDGAKGDDGDSPVITASKNEGVTSIFVDGNLVATVSDGEKGEDGDSPVITTEKSGKVLTILADDVSIGTVSDGEDGQDGQDGHSPVVAATKSGSTTSISVDGTVVATVNDGAKGDKGDTGDSYVLTEADKQDIAGIVEDDVLADAVRAETAAQNAETYANAAEAAANVVASEFSASTAYAVGDYVLYNGGMYCFKVAHAAGAWNSAHVDAVTVGGELSDLKDALSDLEDDISHINVETDKTLSIADKPADAKSVGDKVGLIETELGLGSVEINPGTPSRTSYSVNGQHKITGTANNNTNGYVVDLSDYAGKFVRVFFTTTSTGSRCTGICSADNTVKNPYYMERAMTEDGWLFEIDDVYNQLYISYERNLGFNLKVTIEEKTISSKIEEIESSISSLSEDVAEIPNLSSASGYVTKIDPGTPTNVYYSGNIGKVIVSNSNANSYGYVVDLSEYTGLTARVMYKTTGSTTRLTALCDANGIISESYMQRDIYDGSKFYFDFVITSTYNQLYISYEKNMTTGLQVLLLAVNSEDNDSNTEKIIYVATTGNDDNDGTTSQKAVKTVAKAIALGATSILIAGGIYEENSIPLTKVKTLKMSTAWQSSRAIFVPANSLLATSETKVSGYTKVYSVTGSFSSGGLYKWIFQQNVPDEATLISDEERHPAQRGKAYRCDDTLISICSSANLSDALQEIDNSEKYKFYYDSTNGTVYYSRPQPVNETNPLRYSVGGVGLFTGANRKNTLILSGIEAKYMTFNVGSTVNSVLTNCKASSVHAAGCFKYDMALNITFVKCEAERAHENTAAGDGFNGHGEYTGDATAYQTTCSLIDCWSHDNVDDGYSDHERAETLIRGGLYEYNGKAGVTPSFGSHCSIYDVLSRKNYSGFMYTGEATASEGGKYGQMICYNCVAQDNVRGDLMSGFVVRNNGNSMKLINCKSIGNSIGYNIQANARGELIDCGSKDDTTPIVKSGTVVINNTTLVS